MSSLHSEQAVRLPTQALRPFIARYAGYCVQGLPPGTHAGLPSRHVHLIIGLGSPIDIDPADAERIFRALAENGTAQMPIQKTFWAVRFGVLVDQFGIPWAINCEQAPSVA